MQKNNFLNQYYELESYISKIAPNRIEQYKKNIENIEKDIEVAKKYHTGDFHIKVLDKYDSDTRAEANKIIHNLIRMNERLPAIKDLILFLIESQFTVIRQ